MSISSSLSNSNSNNKINNMSKNSFFDLRKQASFYIKEKIKTARLALTDVTPIQLMTEEATNANPWAPNTQTLGLISRAAFEVDDYWRIVDILHNKLSKFDRKEWRASYNSLVVLEYLLTHGPERVAEEFQTHKSIIDDMKFFQHIDEKGFNWGLTVRKKSEKILKLLENGPLLKEERENARKITREIKGFGSFSEKSSFLVEEPSTIYGRSHSQFNEHGNDENHYETNGYYQPTVIKTDKPETVKRSFKENMAPKYDVISKGGLHSWSNNKAREENSLLCGSPNDRDNGGMLVDEEEHPFSKTEKYSRVSLLDAAI
ncbi:epsin-3 [Silene latifolia]|uniref:epsin-3 n=1 Tax=Silene latifolia TaxID=37657 RepID=UPI003D76EECF